MRKRKSDVWDAFNEFKEAMGKFGIKDTFDIETAFINALPTQAVYVTATYEWTCPNCGESYNDVHSLDETTCRWCGLKVVLETP